MALAYTQTSPPKEVVAYNEAFTLAASVARTSGANGTALFNLAIFRRLIIVLDITASAAVAGDTLDVYVDVSLDNGKWLNVIHFTQQAGNGAPRTEFAILDPSAPGAVVINVTSDAASGVVRPSLWGPYIRARWAVVDGGAHGQSHTFSVSGYGQS